MNLVLGAQAFKPKPSACEAGEGVKIETRDRRFAVIVDDAHLMTSTDRCAIQPSFPDSPGTLK
jgi:hypothetical protein